jgi:lysophospholipase L1-like esterase
MIGTNNIGSGQKPAQVIEGITAIVRTLREKRPNAQILLLAVFPRDPQRNSEKRQRINEVNQQIAHLDDGRHVHYLDIGPKFLGPDGELTKEIMPDYLHLSPKGYQIWANAIQGSLDQMLKKTEAAAAGASR